MLSLVILVGIAISGVLGSSMEECMEHVDLEQMKEMAEKPTPDDLSILCPQIVPFLDCVSDFVESQLGITLEDLARLSPDPTVAKGATFLVNVRSLFQDLCTEGSELNTEYNEHVECYNSIPNSLADECQTQAVDAYHTYKEFEDSVQEEAGDNTRNDNRDCMVAAYMIGCLEAEIHQTCGQSAFETFHKIVKRSTILKSLVCSEEDIEHLKTSFLDALDMKEGDKDIFRLAFDLRKRRK